MKWIKASERLPENSKEVFAKDDNGRKYSALYARQHTIDVEDFDENGDLDDFKDTLYLKPGWYELCEQQSGQYDEIYLRRNIVEWLDESLKEEGVEEVHIEVVKDLTDELAAKDQRIAELEQVCEELNKACEQYSKEGRQMAKEADDEIDELKQENERLSGLKRSIGRCVASMNGILDALEMDNTADVVEKSYVVKEIKELIDKLQSKQ